MKVYAAIQEERSGRVFVVLTDDMKRYHWMRATPGQVVQGPFDSMLDLFISLAELEGKSVSHWKNVFSHFYPNIQIGSQVNYRLSV